MVALFALFSLHAQSMLKTPHLQRRDITEILGFEPHVSGNLPVGWSGGPPGTVFADDTTVHSGRWAVRLDRVAHSPGNISSVTSSFPVDFAGKEIEFRGFLRTKGVTGFAGLWLREDGESGKLEFDDMEQKHVSGTRDWEDFSIRLPLNHAAQHLYFGALLAGTGVAWVDDLQILLDGVPIARATERQKSSEYDNRFDYGSGIELTELTRLQIENLTTLAHVWGFLKYHHPVVTAGKRRWDYSLLSVMPSVLAAHSRAEANAQLVKWIDSLGPIDVCSPCASLDPFHLALRPDIAWIGDTDYLGVSLGHLLTIIYQDRVPHEQHYVSFTELGNPVFENESNYPSLVFPDPGYQLLGLLRFWNIVEYWAPYRNQVGENWLDVLSEFIPRVALAKDRDSYTREMLALLATVHDSHANLLSSLSIRPPLGRCRLPVNLRFIGQKAIITGFTSEASGETSGLKPGDEIVALDGVPVASLVSQWTPLYAASNDASRLRDIAQTLTTGNCGPTHIEIRRNDRPLPLSATRVDKDLAGASSSTHDLPGPTFRLLSSNIAYLKLSSIKAKEIPNYIKAAMGTRGLIVDIRNYPSEFVALSLGSLFVDRPTPFVSITTPDPSNPGAFHRSLPVSLLQSEPHYAGKIIVLVDEVTQSQAEYTAMALSSAPHALVVGSTTTGADGNVSEIPLPGLYTEISGLGIFYPDGRPTQRIGIHVDVEARPTVDGLRAGRDEVLEAAIRQIAPELPDSEIEKMTHPDRVASF